jgi:hypothetical protein
MIAMAINVYKVQLVDCGDVGWDAELNHREKDTSEEKKGEHTPKDPAATCKYG